MGTEIPYDAKFSTVLSMSWGIDAFSQPLRGGNTYKMVTLSGFIKEEVNGHIKNVILKTINEGKASNKTNDELVFNRYSLEFDFTKEKITIYDDVFSEDRPLSIQLEHFINAILNISE